MTKFETVVKSLWNEEWDISIDPNRDSDSSTVLLEHSEIVFEKFSSQSLIIDRFPRIIEDNFKFSALNVNFSMVEDKQALKELYMKEEEKYQRLFKLLWAHDSVWVETSLRTENAERIKEVLHDETKERRVITLQDTLNEGDTDYLKVDHVADLEVLLELGLRETVSTVFVFEKLKICIWSNYDLNMPAYIGTLDSQELLQTIATTEGLYLRPFMK